MYTLHRTERPLHLLLLNILLKQLPLCSVTSLLNSVSVECIRSTIPCFVPLNVRVFGLESWADDFWDSGIDAKPVVSSANSGTPSVKICALLFHFFACEGTMVDSPQGCSSVSKPITEGPKLLAALRDMFSDGVSHKRLIECFRKN